MSSTFNETNLVKKLENVTSSQDSIQTLSLWVLHHRNHYKKIVDQWLKCYIKAKSDHQLALFYLANDIVQHAKRKNLSHYLNEFMNALREAAKITNDEKIMNNINRVLNIWQERSVYSKEFIQELRELLCGEKIKAELMSKVISEFSLSDVLNQLNNIVKIEQITRSKYQNLVNCKIEFANSDLLNKLKDKSYGDQFSKELDEATKCLETAIMAIENEIANRKMLLGTLEKSKVYYAIQMKEAKTIAETFNSCEVRLKQVQNKMASLSGNKNSSLNSSEINSSQLSSVLSFIHPSRSSATVSSLDQRLTSLMSGTGQFNLNIDQGPYGASNNFYSNDTKKRDPPILVQPARPFGNEQSENFEPADMDLGDSEDEDNRQAGFSNASQKSSMPPPPVPIPPFINNQTDIPLLPMMPPPPPPPPMPPIIMKEFFGSIENDLNNSFNSQPDSIRNAGTSNSHHGQRNSSSFQNSSQNSNHWRNDNNNRNNNNNRNYHHHYNNSSRNNSRWKNDNSWKRNNYDRH